MEGDEQERPSLHRLTDGETALTQMGQVQGTPPYMAPEQARGERVGPPADVWALGAALYALLTGRPPYSGHTIDELVARARECRVPPPGEAKRGVPKPLDAVCLKAMAPRPESRYADARALG